MLWQSIPGPMDPQCIATSRCAQAKHGIVGDANLSGVDNIKVETSESLFKQCGAWKCVLGHNAQASRATRLTQSTTSPLLADHAPEVAFRS